MLYLFVRKAIPNITDINRLIFMDLGISNT